MRKPRRLFCGGFPKFNPNKSYERINFMESNLKEKKNLKEAKVVNSIKAVGYTLALAYAQMAPAVMLCTDAKGKSLVTSALGFIGTILLVPAAIMLIIGIYHYAMANSEGDGPATSKAAKQIASGIMMGLVAALMKVAGAGGALTDLINSIFS